jgi:hypothetical protein
MAILKSFPMKDGPAIPYVLAEIIYEAYRSGSRAHKTMAQISDEGGFYWAEVPLYFGQVRKKDRFLYEDLLLRARSIPSIDNPGSSIVDISKREVAAAIRQVDEMDMLIAAQQREETEKVAAARMRVEKLLAEQPDYWEEHAAHLQSSPPPVVNAPLTIVCWKWNSPGYKTVFLPEHVHTLQKMIKRHYPRPHRFVCITDDPRGLDCETYKLWKDHSNLPNISGKHLPSCYRRLKIFSKEMAEVFGPRILSMDLDVILTGDVTHIFDRPDPFVGWKVPGVNVPEVYNGSMFLFTAGAYSWIWETFDPEKSPRIASLAGYQGSDQGWISFCLKAREPGWGKHDGVYSYPRDVRHTTGLPVGARIVIFHGQRKPWDRRWTRDRAWIAKHYR